MSSCAFYRVQEYFTATEWSQALPYERLRYKNILENFELSVQLEMPMKKPDFMLRHEKRLADRQPKAKQKQTQKKLAEKKAVEKKEPRVGRRGLRPKRPLPPTQPQQPSSAGEPSTSGGGYSLRAKKRVNYCEPEPEEDVPPEVKHFDHVFCYGCGVWTFGGCLEHPLIFVSDNTAGVPGSPLFSRESCPEGLSVCRSDIDLAGYGVWADVEFPQGIAFGPYTGVEMESYSEADQSGYSWEIFQDGRRSFIDGEDEREGNWMRYINHATQEEKKNVEANQMFGEIYYITLTEIKRGTELLVSYGPQYHRTLVKTAQPPSLQKPTRAPSTIGGEVFQCRDCPSAFTSAEFLAKHRDKKHLQREFSCPHCTYSTDHSQGHINCHIAQVHEKSAQKEHKCDICGKSFLSSSNLANHARIHSGDRPFQCPECGKDFTEKGTLTRHQKAVHKGERAFCCSICGKTFNQKQNLDDHQRMHSGQKPYRCEVCDKRFTQKSNLTNHLRVHTGDKPFECSICQQKFSHSSSRNSHERKVHQLA